MVSIKPSEARLRYACNGIFLRGVPVDLDDTFRFDCLRCGTCCEHTPRVNPEETLRMAKYLNMSRAEFFKRYLTLKPDENYGWKAEVDKIGYNCALYSKEKGKASCKVHPVKPRQCVSRPIERLGSKVTAKGIVPDLTFEFCRGFGRGKEYTVREWIKNQNLEELWEEEADYYFNKIDVMKQSMSIFELKKKIEELFLS